MALDLGKLLSENVPRMGPQREQSVYIDIDKLVSDERNFYELSDIDGLVRNIELIGLQQPIRVREVDGMYRIVSGHRRRAALQKLVDEGKEQFREVHCIVETVECSEAMQELRLIYANSDTRRMSQAEIDRQAQHIEAILLRMKEEGYQFEGRMRDHVAEICKVSKSKLSRLKVIREKLHPMLMADWEEGRLSEAVAYRIAQEPERIQNQLFSDNGHAPRNWTLEHAERAIGKVKNPPASKPIGFGKLDAREAANDYLTKWEEERVWVFENIRDHIFEHFIGGFTCIQTRKDGVDYLKAYCSSRGHWGAVHYDSSKSGMEIYKDSRSREMAKRSWTEVWDTMAVVAMQRCAAEHNKPKQKEAAHSAWMPGSRTPDTPCDAVVVFDLGDKRIKRLCRWNGTDWVFETGGVKIEMPALKWLALPEEETKC